MDPFTLLLAVVFAALVLRILFWIPQQVYVNLLLGVFYLLVMGAVAWIPFEIWAGAGFLPAVASAYVAFLVIGAIIRGPVKKLFGFP